MKYPGKNKSARTGIRVSLPLLILVLVIVTSVLIIYSTPVLTIEKRTSGNLTFTDGTGDLLSGTIEISMIGAPPGRKSNVNSITWRNAPNAWIYFDAHEKKSVSINLRISGDSPYGRVLLEDHGADMPGSVGVPVPGGVPVKYVELHSTGVSIAEADIYIYYTDAELKGLDENSLVIYSYDGGEWTELPTRVDAAKNVVSAAAVTLSVFAVSTRASERIEIRDTRGMPVTSEVKTYDEARTLKKQEKTSTLSSANIPDGGELEVDAMKTKNVSVRLRMSRADGGSIILDNYGRKNPVFLPLPGKALKFVEIGASNISFIHADITIQYSDAELGDQDENRLLIYHYKNGAWSDLSTGVDAANNTLTASADSLSVFAISAFSSEWEISVIDSKGSPINATIVEFGNGFQDNSLIRSYNVSTLSTAGLIYNLIAISAYLGFSRAMDSLLPAVSAAPDTPRNIKIDALKQKNVMLKLENYTVIQKNPRVILDDFGKNNPVSVPLPGMAVKYVEIGAKNISFSYANITIRYTDADLNGGSEIDLALYHWNGASWDAVPTIVDTVNKTLSASTASLSFWGVATLYRQALRCDTGTTIGTSDTTNSACGSSYTTLRTALLLAPTGTTSSTIQFSAFTGERLYAYFVNNTAYSTDVNVTGVNGSISMDDNYDTGSVYGKLGIGYYDPNGAADNFVGLFNSTETSAVTSGARASYPVSFNNNYGIIPANNKLAVRVWMRTTASMQPNFYTYRTTSTYDSSVNFTIAYPNASISGYVTNASSGLPLSGANVTTNTSKYSITDATGFYIISGLSNGTYYVNASLNGYVTNSTIQAISGSDVTNYNITLSSVVLSGYVKDNSSGAPLSGATVMTNTSNTTTTDATGYYSFTGLLNGTYIVNASLSNYATNSTNVTINNANVTNANITLLRGYLLSGYVTNASNGAAIPGANVTTNTSQTTTTNATGYYNFTLSNGTYLITASNTSYSDNSTTQTINGANVTNVNITLAGVTVETGKILVATDRFVILDDDFTGTPESGFASPAFGSGSGDPSGGNDAAKGKATTIGAYALYIDSNGFPVPGRTITFTFSRPAAYGVFQTINATTDANGTARAFSNIDDTRYWGRWKVKAENSTFSANTTFIYNWWGCNYNDNDGGCDKDHSGKDWSTGAAINSPYMDGYDRVVNDKGDHQVNYVCTGCHRSYDGTNGTANNVYPSTASTIQSGIHAGIRCDNTSCHNTISTHTTNAVIGSCYGGAGCHALRTDVSGKTTLNGVVSRYSNSSSGTYDRYHTPNSTVLCIICHGPMHNTTKPDNSTRRNNVTESEQCTTCHASYNKHNNSVNCTLCHSDDAHAIKVFAQNATYINLTRSAPNPARGNCTNCHQNSSFYAALKAQPNATNQSGRNPPIVATPLEHSNDSTAGAKWKQTYWTNSQQLSWCIYCHSNTTHSTVALGRPASWDGNNIVNSSLTSNTTWCSVCHWQGYANGSNTYGDMVNAFTGAGLLVPPEISGNATYGANTSIYEYTNHSLYTRYYPNLNDSACNRCHGYNYGFTTITQLVHNQSRVGGANCVDCHDIGGIALLAHVNVTTANDTNAIHKNLSKNAAHVLNTTVYYDNNLRCWACHSNGSEPSTPNAHPTGYKMPDNCTDCHIQSATQNFNFTPNSTLLNVTEHYWNADEIHTPAVSTCYACHNLSEMMIFANDPDSGSGAVYGGANAGNNSTSHYGKKRVDLRIGINASCSYCHQNASTVFTTAMIDPAYNSTISNHSLRYNSSNPSCTSSQCHKTGWLHNNTLTKPNLTLPNSSYCLSCHGSNGTGSTNYSGAVTEIKEKHNNTINCSECHLNTSKDVHPMKYLQPNASYNSSNSTAVNCITCHQATTVDSKLSLAPPKIPSSMAHSDNASNGTLWNSTAYWTPASPLTSCIYCHNDTKHNATALGRPANWKGNNIVNSSLSTGTWCASCHYKNYSSGGKNYSNMTGAFTSANLPVPPEITNGSYAVNIYNRSNYYNHSLKDYSDAVCILCHGANLSSTSRISAFLHNISWGSCTSCHYSFEAMNNTTRPDRYVDQGMYNTSLHRSLSCQNCHTQGHRNIGARKACEDCHAVQANPITDKDRHNITSTPSTYYYNSVNVVNITDCTTCHSGTLYNTSIATYGYGKSKDCDYCHTYPDKYYE